MDYNMLNMLIWSTGQRMNKHLDEIDIVIISEYVSIAIEDGADLSMDTIRKEITRYLENGMKQG